LTILNKPTYVIIGANGFIGKALNASLSGENIIAIGRSLQHNNINGEQYYSIQETSLNELEVLLQELTNPIVIDLSYTSISNALVADNIKDFSDNISLVIRNLKFAKAIRAVKYMYVSSGGAIYGKSEEEKISELHKTNPISHYGIIKLASEKYVQMFCSMNALNYSILRPSNVYGPGQMPFQGQGIIATVIGSALQKKPITVYGKGDNIRDFIFVDDFCKWMIQISKNIETNMIYNAGSGEGISMLKIIDLIGDVMNRDNYKFHVQYLPDRPFDVKRNVLDNSRIIDKTGLGLSTTIYDGIAAAYDWINCSQINQSS
jgi:UDP-glucose 4-epimerase